MMKVEKSIIEKAKSYAISAHRRINQRRKYSFQPYEIHLESVANIVAGVTQDEEMIAAAWLHDIVEDTPATFEDIERAFGKNIAALVHELSDVSKIEDGNRMLRKQIDRAHTAATSNRAQLIKLADLIDNCGDICANDPGFGKVFLGEMEALLGVMDENLHLYGRAKKTCEKWKKILNKFQEEKKCDDEERSWWSLVDNDKRKTIKASVKFLMVNFTASDIAKPLKSVAPKSKVEQIVDTDAPLSLVVNILTYFDDCYVEKQGKVCMHITRKDFETPIGRTWIAGIIILYDQTVTDMILELWPNDAWQEQLSQGRLKKAMDLAAERQRRKKTANLIDCLQFSDKLQLIGKNRSVARMFGYTSGNAIKRVHQDLESLRNNIAHGQQIFAEDWAQIARLAERITEILSFQQHN